MKNKEEKLQEFENEMIRIWSSLYNEEKLYGSILTCCEAFGFLRCISKILIGRYWICEATKKVVDATTFHMKHYQENGMWDKLKDC